MNRAITKDGLCRIFFDEPAIRTLLSSLALFLASSSLGCNSKPRFVHVGGANPSLMFDNVTAQNCWAGPSDPPTSMPPCHQLEDGTWVKPVAEDPFAKYAVPANQPAKPAPPCPKGVPSGVRSEQLKPEDLAQIVGRAADFNGSNVSYGLANNSRYCITAFTAMFEFQSKSGSKTILSTTEQVTDTLSPAWFLDGKTFYALKTFEKHYSLYDSRSVDNGEVDYASPRLPVALVSWHVTKAWGFEAPKGTPQ